MMVTAVYLMPELESLPGKLVGPRAEHHLRQLAWNCLRGRGRVLGRAEMPDVEQGMPMLISHDTIVSIWDDLEAVSLLG